MIIWCCVAGVAALVGFTTRGAELAVFGESLLFGAMLFGAPVQWFVFVNLRQLRACARDDVLLPAVVERADVIGRPAQRVVDASVRCEVPGHGSRLVRVSGLASAPPVGGTLEVLFVAGRPELAGVVAPPVGILLGRVLR